MSKESEFAMHLDEKPSILIVDDSLTVRMDLREAFESAGMESFPCETLAVAREALAHRAFSLVILDILLPDGDGTDLLREIKALPGTPIPVLLLSTQEEVCHRIRDLKIGADDYVGKPYDREYILTRARQLMKNDALSSQPKVLLIDDSATFRHEFQAVLESAGYRVDAAESGEEGLKATLAVQPDAIIVDQTLIGAMDGRMVIGRLKQDVTLRNIPCLLLTGSAESDEELRALDAGADAYMNKDMDMQVILARIAAMLRPGRPVPAVSVSGSSLLGPRKILAVDDSPTFLNEVSTELRQEGYEVVQACSGKAALDILDSQAVDCILLDVRMPELSGNQTCQMIRQRPAFRNIPLLMLTAMEAPEAVIEGINSGADDYVSKSSDFTILKARVRAQLRRKQFEDEYRTIREELLQNQLATAHARAAQEIAEARAAMVDELAKKNRELEAFTYSVSHDLRAPLRTVSGYAKALSEDFGPQFPKPAQEHLERVLAGAARMSKLIDALLELSRTSRANLHRETFDLSSLARSIAAELSECDASRHVECAVQDGILASGDAALIRVVLNNLLGNAWKFTSKTSNPRIEVGALNEGSGPVFFVRDNGAGFDSTRSQRLFQPFERLHPATDFPGAGIGLATVRRIIERHQGRVWAESAIGKGATFLFTLDKASSEVASALVPAARGSWTDKDINGARTQSPPRTQQREVSATGSAVDRRL